MFDLPVADPGDPDARSAARYLLWLCRTLTWPLAGAMASGIAWTMAPAFMPVTIGWAIDAIVARDRAGLLLAAAALAGLGVGQAIAGVCRHRLACYLWLASAYRTIQVTVAQAARLGATLPKKVATGEVVSVGTADINQIGNVIDIMARGSGALVSTVVVTALLLRVSVPLGLTVLIGVPVLMAVVAVLLRPLHRRTREYRDASGALTNRAGDIVAGLRVLRGIGGEAAFGDRYRAHSQEVRAAGLRVARLDSALQGVQVLLPGIFVTLVTWMAARFALAGQISPGDLVAFYGYATFLMFPLRTLTEAAIKTTSGLVAARRVVRILRLSPEIGDPDRPAPVPTGTDLHDPDSAVRIGAGRFTAIAAADPADAEAIADRLGRFDPASRARLGGVALADLPVAAVRSRILVADNDARLFNGPLRDGIGDDPRAVHAASAEDILDAAGESIVERGREFSGGQQQRLRLVRALRADPPVLVLVEPTSAVDAHTEARIAARLGAQRRGRTTVVCTTSPLVLDRADHVVYVERGRAVAAGRHRDLLDTSPGYRATVTRGEA